jgi:TolA-binding protein
MHAPRVVIVLFAGVAACATPGQVRQVATQVQLADHERARADSAERAEIARVQIMLRQNVDSMNSLYHALSDLLQRMSRDDASGFLSLQQQFYQLTNLTSTTAANLNRLNTQVQMAAAGPPTSAPTDTSNHGNVAGAIPQPAVLIDQAKGMMLQSAYQSARRSLNQLLVSYPQAPEVPEALYQLGYSYDNAETADSARFYYNRVWKEHPKDVRASNALFKLGNIELKAGNIAEARKYWQQIVTDYAQSLEFESAARCRSSITSRSSASASCSRSSRSWQGLVWASGSPRVTS